MQAAAVRMLLLHQVLRCLVPAFSFKSPVTRQLPRYGRYFASTSGENLG